MESVSNQRRPASGGWSLRHVWSALGVLLLLVWSPFYFAIGLVAPGWVVVPAVVVWIAHLTLALRWFRSRPPLVLVTGVVAVALWLGAVWFFDVVLGWTA